MEEIVVDSLGSKSIFWDVQFGRYIEIKDSEMERGEDKSRLLMYQGVISSYESLNVYMRPNLLLLYVLAIYLLASQPAGWMDEWSSAYLLLLLLVPLLNLTFSHRKSVNQKLFVILRPVRELFYYG